jgi:hypothetical protein
MCPSFPELGAPSMARLSALHKFSIRVCILCIWLAQFLTLRDPLDADGIAYLDIARSFAHGHWHALVNGYWSPGLPFLLSIPLRLFKPDRFRDPFIIHALAFLTLCAAMLAFEYFLKTLAVYRATVLLLDEEPTKAALPDDETWLLGYALFFWITTFWLPPALQQPDILVFVIYLLAAALCLQLSHRTELWRYALLGIVLALGYVIKAVMFPLGLVFLLALCLQQPRLRSVARVALAGVIFVVLSLPFCLALSSAKGRFTYGDAGVINYRHIMGLDSTPLPPTALPRPAATPHIQNYSNKLHLGTYPPWADPSYEFKGWKFVLHVKMQLNRTHVVLREYFDDYVVLLGALTCGIIILFTMGDTRKTAARFLRCQVLWLPATTGLLFYATMRVSGRFLAGYTVALAASCFAAIWFRESDSRSRLMRAIALTVSVLLFLPAVVEAGHQIVGALRSPRPDLEVAKALQGMGIQEDDRVSYMGDALTDSSWAHLAGAKIVAEIPSEDVASFWAANREQQQEVLHWLAATNAKVLVTRDVPRPAMSQGWRRVRDSSYYILPLANTPQ